MKRKEFPIWFKVETILFLFFSAGVVISYVSRKQSFDDPQRLLIKLIILLVGVLLMWLSSWIICCFEK